ncbi:MAG TPA: heme-dependent oxidative N-demethylase subunit alpha family protein [Verrucomicrobiales bacterium]|nr:heme-dependent oxidative N-demethylase subunit alpha family protein [Verrucomicrobiales bacterium]
MPPAGYLAATLLLVLSWGLGGGTMWGSWVAGAGGWLAWVHCLNENIRRGRPGRAFPLAALPWLLLILYLGSERTSMDPESELIRDTGLLARLRDEDFHFSLKGWTGASEAYFGNRSLWPWRLAERAHWLDAHPDRYCGSLPEAEPALLELAGLLRAWTGGEDLQMPDAGAPREELCLALGQCADPDWVVLQVDAETGCRVIAGAVCFPTGWDFESALGEPLREIHAAVPGLNAAAGPRIERLLAALRPGQSWERMNWGLTLSRELNQHPARDLPKLDAVDTLSEVWLRLEWQSLSRMPSSGCVLFGIRPLHLSFEDLAECAGAGATLRRQLSTMPEPMRRYKRLAGCLERLLRRLDGQDE